MVRFSEALGLSRLHECSSLFVKMLCYMYFSLPVFLSDIQRLTDLSQDKGLTTFALQFTTVDCGK
jgi:hypothetical protein